jgi:hypothetical protein
MKRGRTISPLLGRPAGNIAQNVPADYNEAAKPEKADEIIV